MVSEIDYFCKTTTPQADQLLAKEHIGGRSNNFQSPSVSSMQLYDKEFFASDCQDFLGWSMDGETTTEPASDDLDGGYQIGSSSSDEDSERQVPWVRSSQSWKTSTHSHSLASREQPQNGTSLRSLLAKAPPPPRSEVSDIPASNAVTREELPEEGLVDIEPEEGKRRGGELLAMLMPCESAQEKSVLARSTETSLSDTSLAAPRFATRLSRSGASCQPLRSCLHQSKRPQWSASWEPGWEAMTCGGTHSSSMDSSRHAVAIQHAAQDAFGALLKEVTIGTNGVYIVSLHTGMRQYDEVPVLSILGRALWPLLGREVKALEPIVDLDGHQRLIMRMHGDIDSQSCWEFATTGTCPRGSRCRWEHTPVAVHHAYIEVVY
mmetsp:Transcript_34001/g.54200  ORF Transcript_34001/g.54200 Transcript_34001/m.54200 type:complete len:378 (+) Transcript_34001:90-1223(+)